MGRHIPILYASLVRFGIITSLYTEAPMLLRLRSPNPLILSTISSTNPRHIHCATSPAIAHMTFKTCQLRRPLLLPPLHLPPGSHDSVLTDNITTHPTTSYHYIHFLSQSSHLTTLTGRCLDSMLSPAIPLDSAASMSTLVTIRHPTKLSTVNPSSFSFHDTCGIIFILPIPTSQQYASHSFTVACDIVIASVPV